MTANHQGDARCHYRAARKYASSCTAAVRAGTIRMQLLRPSETALPKRRTFDHRTAPSAVMRHVPLVQEPLVPFAPVGRGKHLCFGLLNRCPHEGKSVAVDGNCALRAVAVELHDPDWSARRSKEGQPFCNPVSKPDRAAELD